MYVRLAFAVAAHLDSDILLVDEVLSIGDYSFQRKSLQKMSELIQHEGKSILFVSHVLGSVARLCTRAIQLEKGQLTFQGKTTEVIDRYLTQRGLRADAGSDDRLVGSALQISAIQMLRGEMTTAGQALMGEDLSIVFTLESSCSIQIDSASIEIFNRADESMTHLSSEDVQLPLDRLEAGVPRTLQICLKDLLFSPGFYRIAFWLSGNSGTIEECFPSLLQFQLLKGSCVGRPGEYPPHVKTYVRSQWNWR
jgi:lipopolysaccharide transport system ATP-binding protein